MGSSTLSKNKRGNGGDGYATEASELRFRHWLTLGAMLVGPPLLLFLYYKAMFPQLVNPDALDFAQLGRNISAGKGFVTSILRRALLTHGGNPLREPDATHGPLYPLFLALAFGTPLGAKDTVVALVSGLFYLLTAPVLFLLGSRLFNRTIGLVSAAIFVVNSQILEYAISGLHITLYVFLTTCLLLVLHRLASPEGTADGAPEAGKRPFPKGEYALAGALTAALYLTEPVFFWFIPVALGAVFWISGTRRAPALGWFVLPLALLAVPWMVRNAAVTGNPVFGGRGLDLWSNTASYPGDSVYRSLPTELVPGVALFKEILLKMAAGLNSVIQGLPQISAIWVLAFFLPGLLFRFTDRAANQVRMVMLGFFGVLLLSAMAFQVQMPLFVAVIPTMLVFAVACLFHLVQQAQLRRGAIAATAGLLGLAVLYPLIGDVALGGRPQRLTTADSARALGERAGRDDVVLSDQPWIVAWYANRPSVWIPAHDEKVREIRSRYAGARWLFLSDGVRGYSPEWEYVYSAFLQWNVTYSRVQAEKMAAESRKDPKAAALQLPPTWTIQGTQTPLFAALQGFSTVGSAAETDPNTVIAAVAAPPAKVGLRPQEGASRIP